VPTDVSKTADVQRLVELAVEQYGTTSFRKSTGETMEQNKDQKNPMSQINRALGLFLLCFGVIILISIFFTETVAGKITNMAAGFIFVIIGLLMMFKRKVKSEDL